MDSQRIHMKRDVSREIWEKLEKEIRERKLSQTKLQNLCRELGYEISQAELSRLHSGKSSLTLYQLIALSAALGSPAARFLESASDLERSIVHGKGFIIDSSDDAFKPYLGEFYTMQHSTSAFQDKILFGKLEFGPAESGKICKAVMRLDTGEKDHGGREIWKKYSGQLVISQKLGAAYCFLMNDRLGEINVVFFRHRNFFVKEMQCRIGLVLTISAGETKLPAVQRLLISRGNLEGELAALLVPYLKLTLNPVGESIIQKEKLKEVLSQEEQLGRYIQEEYVLLDESLFLKTHKLEKEEQSKIVSKFRREAIAPYVLKTEQREDDLVYMLMEKFRNSDDG